MSRRRSSTSDDQNSLEVPPGPSVRCCAWPAAKSGLETHFWKSSSERQRVTTRQTSRSSLGRRSSKPSNPSKPSTRPARDANRRSNSSKRSRGTVIALILTTLTPVDATGSNQRMITITVTSVLVDDQDKALRFYTEVLGFRPALDIPLGEYRWLTVV